MPHNVLPTVSWAADTLSREPQQLFHVLRVLLTDLRRATRMDAAELYLADPQQSYLLLSGHAGEDGAAFEERRVFQFGEGFPGLAAASREMVMTSALSSDGRYLRERVRTLGYQAFLSYPLLLPHAVVGVVNLAAKDPAHVETARRSLGLVTPVLAASLYTVMTSLGERTLARIQQARTTRERILVLLEESLEVTSGLRASLQLTGCDMVETHPGEAAPCPGSERCPAQAGHLQISGLEELTCTASAERPYTACLPVWEGQEVRGVTTVQFAGPHEAQQGTVLPLLWMGRLATSALRAETPPAEPASHPWLDIQTLGPFRVSRAGEALTPKDFKRRQAYQLLKVLVARLGRSAHTDELCEALWPGEVIDDRVRARLHVTVSALRAAIEPADAAVPQVIIRDGLSYRFQPGDLARIDAQQFEALVQEADAQGGVDALRTYRRALLLYQGDFLGDDPYAEGFELERDYMRELAIRSLFRCAELQELSGLTQEALTSYSRILTIDPLRFEAHEALIGFLIQQDRVEDAQVRWERYARAYGSPPPIPSPLAPPGTPQH